MGVEATGCVSALFRPAVRKLQERFPVGPIVFGRWTCGHGEGEELVVCRRSQQVVEVHCHGGRMAARSIVDSLIDAGCREVPWQEMAAVCEDDPIATEARVALAASRTERTAAILLDQYRGALRAVLIEILGLLEKGDTGAATNRLLELNRYSEIGVHLTGPWRIVLTGHANVGKSSLINAVLGYQRSIVYEQPGTTRDVVTAHTAIDGWPVELADTAGLREDGDAIESAGVAFARQRLDAADIVVLVFDSTERWTDEAASLLDQWPEATIVHNKCDLIAQPADDRPVGLRTSAVTGAGVQELIGELAARLVPEPPPPGTAVPFSERHVDAVRRCISLLDAGETEEASKLILDVIS
jgi:tRNA modification GTPase